MMLLRSYGSGHSTSTPPCPRARGIDMEKDHTYEDHADTVAQHKPTRTDMLEKN